VLGLEQGDEGGPGAAGEFWTWQGFQFCIAPWSHQREWGPVVSGRSRLSWKSSWPSGGQDLEGEEGLQGTPEFSGCVSGGPLGSSWGLKGAPGAWPYGCPPDPMGWELG
jgi:hypothetical protein